MQTPGSDQDMSSLLLTLKQLAINVSTSQLRFAPVVILQAEKETNQSISVSNPILENTSKSYEAVANFLY